ncbi:MAG: DUF192 domain-containing protein [Opitutales bacterium]
MDRRFSPLLAPRLRRVSIWKLWLIVIALGLAGCGGNESGETASTLRTNTPPAVFSTRFEIGVGSGTVQAQVALETNEQARGLMFRESLEPDEGMFFIFERPQPMGFWMRNVSIPLDIAYITPDGVIREIYPLHPFVETPVRSRRSDLQIVLEMRRDWFADNDVQVEDTIDLTALTEAMRARGVDPELYAIAP